MRKFLGVASATGIALLTTTGVASAARISVSSWTIPYLTYSLSFMGVFFIILMFTKPRHLKIGEVNFNNSSAIAATSR